MLIDDVIVSGVIDLLYGVGVEWVIVDYKTDRAADVAVLRERYEPQGAAYALAVEAATGGVVRAVADGCHPPGSQRLHGCRLLAALVAWVDAQQLQAQASATAKDAEMTALKMQHEVRMMEMKMIAEREKAAIERERHMMKREMFIMELRAAQAADKTSGILSPEA
jgi:hypothetical protein